MNGFIREARRGLRRGCWAHPDLPVCSLGALKPDVMGYHDWHEIPNYWEYARHFALQDHMFEPVSVAEPAVAPVHGLRVVGPLPSRAEPMSCVERA